METRTGTGLAQTSPTGIEADLPEGHPLVLPRILYVNWVRDEDGAAVHVREVARELEALGVPLRVLWHRGHAETTAAAPSTPARKPRLLAWLLHEPKEFLGSLPEVVREIREVRRFRPDWILCRYTQGKWTSALVSRFLGIPLIVEINGLYDLENHAYRSEHLQYRPLMRWVERRLLGSSSGVTVVSTALREHICQQYGIPKARILVNPNGAELPEPCGAEELRRKREGFGIGMGPLVVFAGSFQKFHGLDLLASVAGRVLESESDAGFVILGDGPERNHLEALRKRFPGRVLLTGRLPVEEARTILGACHLGIVPDCLPYGSPLKLLEYAAAGLAIVAPDHPSVRELVVDGVSGLLFPPRDESALQERLQALLRDEKLRARLGVAARERVRQSLSWRHNAERIVQFGLRKCTGGG